MCKGGLLVWLGQEGRVRVGETVWNTWKGGGAEKRGGETKIFKGGKLVQGVGALKRGAQAPLQTMYFINQLAD